MCGVSSDEAPSSRRTWLNASPGDLSHRGSPESPSPCDDESFFLLLFLFLFLFLVLSVKIRYCT